MRDGGAVRARRGQITVGARARQLRRAEDCQQRLKEIAGDEPRCDEQPRKVNAELRSLREA